MQFSGMIFYFVHDVTRMGCNLSSDNCVVDYDKELNQYLNQRDIKLVHQSWDFIQDDLEHVGLIMFQR